jgi:hypothetical protein
MERAGLFLVGVGNLGQHQLVCIVNVLPQLVKTLPWLKKSVRREPNRSELRHSDIQFFRFLRALHDEAEPR